MPNQPPIGLGVIGCGARARAMLMCVPDLGSKLVIRRAFDPRASSVARLADCLGVDAPPASDVDQVVNDPRVQWVLVFSPNAQHGEHILAAFRAGKDVFCEKPLATSIQDALGVARAQQRSGRQLVLGFVLRSTSHYGRIAEYVHRGHLGQLVSVEFNETLALTHGGHIHGNWRRFTRNGGGHLLEKCCHDIDILQWLARGRPARVASFGGRRCFTPEHAKLLPLAIDPQRRDLPPDQWFDEDHVDPFTSDKDIVDHQTALIEYDTGLQAVFHTNCAAALPERRLYLCGTEGTLRADAVTSRIEVRRFDDQQTLVIEGEQLSGHGGGDQRLGKQFADVLYGRAAPLAGVREGLESTVVALILEKARHSGCVESLGPWWEKVDAVTARSQPAPA